MHVIIFTSVTIVIHQNFTGKILVCFNQPIQTSPDFIFLRIRGMLVPIAALVKVMHDDESTRVLALPEPIEIALLQFEKVNNVWKSIGTLTEISQKGAVPHRT